MSFNIYILIIYLNWLLKARTENSKGGNLRGIVFAGGEGPEAALLGKIAASADILAAADSGLVAMEKAGLTPHWILGDMDSLDLMEDPLLLEKYNSSMVLRFPREKDLTDTELAINFLREKGCDEIWIAGGGGGRIDHLFAIRSLFDGRLCPDRWFPGNSEIRCLKDGNLLSAAPAPESLVSVFPVGDGPWQAESSGLKWPLGDLAWENGGGLGLSNVAINGLFEIRSMRGRFLVVMPVFFD